MTACTTSEPSAPAKQDGCPVAEHPGEASQASSQDGKSDASASKTHRPAEPSTAAERDASTPELVYKSEQPSRAPAYSSEPSQPSEQDASVGQAPANGLLCVVAYCGAGGSTLGAERAGLRTVAIDSEPSACMTHADLCSGEVLCEDVGKVDDWATDAMRLPFLFWASPPCQPHSVAGRRKAGSDPREGWHDTMRVITRLRPRWFLMENVQGLMIHRDYCGFRHGTTPLGSKKCSGCLFEQMQADLAEYFGVVQFTTINCADLGLPQSRQRVIMVAGPAYIRWPEPTHASPETVQGTRAPWVSMGAALGLVPGQKAIGGGHNPNRAGDERRHRELTHSPSTTILTSHGGKAGNGGPWITKPAPTVTTTEVKGTRGEHMFKKRPNGNCDRASDALWLGTGRRRLTVDECATLQGFPTGTVFHGTQKQQYRQVGNACPPVLAEAVIRSVMRADSRPAEPPCKHCTRPKPLNIRADADYCSSKCRKAAWRKRQKVAIAADAVEPKRLAYADPVYPGCESVYDDHRDGGRGPVDQKALLTRLQPYDGWAMSTSAEAYPELYMYCVTMGWEVHGAPWVRGSRNGKSTRPHKSYEMVLYKPARSLVRSDWPDDSHVESFRAESARPGHVIGSKSAGFCSWMFQLMDARRGDTLDDLYFGTGGVRDAWALFTADAGPVKSSANSPQTDPTPADAL